MPPASSRVFTDDAVAPAVLDLIRKAKEVVVLVSPYNSFSGHLKNELRLAIQRKVRVTAFYREGEKAEDIGWLVKEGAAAYAVPDLHAKLYFNESTMLLASMNLTGGRNSLEVGMLVDASEAKELREYAKRLMSLGVKFEPAAPAPVREVREPRAPYSTRPEPQQQSEPRDPITRTREKIEGVLTTIKAKVTGGKCIRCAAAVPYDAGNPLCPEHFTEWDKFKNPAYLERYCHKCGKEWRTSFAKPLCAACFTANPASRPPFGRQGFVPDAAASRPDDPAPSPER